MKEIIALLGEVNVEVRAMSDKQVYLAYEEDEGYLVFSLDDTVDPAMGDILSHPHWDDRDGLHFTVRNITQNETIRINLENWSMNRESAYELLGRLYQPTKIGTMEK